MGNESQEDGWGAGGWGSLGRRAGSRNEAGVGARPGGGGLGGDKAEEEEDEEESGYWSGWGRGGGR